MSDNANAAANPYAPPTAAVRDIGTNPDSPEPAGRGSRLGAALLDGLVVVVCIEMPIAFGIGFSALVTRNIDFTQSSARIGIAIGLTGLIGFLYFTIKYVRANGQTIAKRWLGIKVVRMDGSKPSLGRMFWMRNAIGVAVSIVPIVGVIYALVDPLFIFGEKRRCVHDLIADTMVVKA